jgi:LmbE family N-acetylglucosaminyl deacetylase
MFVKLRLVPGRIMRIMTLIATVALVLATFSSGAAQQTPRTLVLVSAHADDEAPIAPILARYAREGVQVYMIIATDGAQGGTYTTIPRGPELARARAEEARCAADALGARPPILLGFPDGKLGDYMTDASVLPRLTQRLAEELQRLRPDVIITWGPDGGYGHPDHRLVSNLVTQLQRAGAPGVTQRIFHMNLPAEAIRAMNPQRGVPPLLIPEAKYFTTRISFTPDDLAAAGRSMVCHKTQFTEEMAQRMIPTMERALNGIIALIPTFSTGPSTDLFR